MFDFQSERGTQINVEGGVQRQRKDNVRKRQESRERSADRGDPDEGGSTLIDIT